MACTLAESPSDPLHRKLQQLRCLCRRLDCYRVERTSSRTGVAHADVQRLFTAHFITKWKSLQLQVTRNAAMPIARREDAIHNVSSRSVSTSSCALKTPRVGIVQN